MLSRLSETSPSSSRWRPLRAAAAAAWIALALVAGARPDAAREIAAGEISPGQVETIEVEVAPAGEVRVIVEQDHIDLAVTVDPGGLAGGQEISFDSPLDRWGVESAVVDAPSGRLLVEVRSVWEGVAPGRYRLLVEPLAGVSAERLAAESAWTRASTAYRRARRGSSEVPGTSSSAELEAAAAAFAEAADRFDGLGASERAAASSHARAALLRRLGRAGEAEESYRRAISLWDRAGLRRLEGKGWNDLGLTLWDQRRLDEAERSFTRALTLQRPFDRPVEELNVEQNRCLVLHARGELAPAVACYERGRDGFAALGEVRQQATVLNNLGYALFALGEPTASIASYEQALTTRRALDDRVGVAQTLNNLAVVHRGIGEIETALDLYDEALELQDELGDRRQEAATLSNLGVLYGHLDEVERAQAYYRRALEARRVLEDRGGEASTLGHLGELHCQSGEVETGLGLLQQAVDLAASLGDRRLEARLLGRLGECAGRGGDMARALAALERSVELLESIHDRGLEADMRRLHAEALIELGRSAEARPILERSLDAELASGDAVGATRTRVALARALRERGELEAARQQAASALDEVETLRRRIAHPELRSAFLGAQREAYEVLAGTLVELHRQRPDPGLVLAAFEVSERARARTLLDLLEDSGVEPLTPPDEDLLAERRELRRRLYLKAERRMRAPVQGPASAGADTFDLEIAEIERRLDAVEARLRSADPRAAALLAPPAPDLGEIRRQLGAETVLLEFLLGEDGGWLWRIDTESLSVHELPGRAALEEDVLALYRTWSRPGSEAEEAEALARKLSRTLLGALWPDLDASGNVRLAIAADDVLHLLPFAALPAPDGSNRVWLERFELVHVASASALVAERRLRRARSSPAERRTLVFADPVFDPLDRRVASKTAIEVTGGERGLPTEPSGRFDRLAFSLEEARAIAALDPDRVELALGFEARVDALERRDLEAYDYLHIASHGVVDLAHPDLSGLLFSRVDAAGRELAGWLHLPEIHDLRLRADLVVLSGCRTAIGRRIRGEGLLSLARGFIHAGSHSVAASLWAVQDRATAELMASLYRHLWQRQAPPSTALRAAQLELRSRHRYRSPFYWAPWVLQGDWR